MKYDYASEYLDIIPLLPDIDFRDPEQARRNLIDSYNQNKGEIDQTGISIEDIFIDHPTLEGGLRLRIYKPLKLNSPCPAILNIHGGGFVIGTIDSDHENLVSIVKALNIIVVTVDYRLAPEHPYPSGLEDCYLALEWMIHHADSLELDVTRTGIMGQSAGGGLCAALALLAKERNKSWICFQYLGIPELDDRLNTPSMKEFKDTPLWWRGNAELSWKYYLGDKLVPGVDEVPITAAPARACIEQLKGLPPACITTMAFDPLRDEGILYAMQLMQAGVSVELHSYPHTFHASTIFIKNNSLAAQAEQNELTALTRGLRLDRNNHFSE